MQSLAFPSDPDRTVTDALVLCLQEEDPSFIQHQNNLSWGIFHECLSLFLLFPPSSAVKQFVFDLAIATRGQSHSTIQQQRD